MKNKLVNIKLHGLLGLSIGQNWNLAVKSVSEAIRAIEILSKRKLYKFLYEKDKEGIKYEILINGRKFESAQSLNIEKPETIKNSELAMNFGNLQTIDIVPVLEGSDSSTLSIIGGVLLIIVGIILLGTPAAPLSPILIIGGLGLVAAGVINLLTSPPNVPPFGQLTNGGQVSYLFNGPQNVTKEGGPVPVGYGRLLIGTQVVSASYDVSTLDANASPLTT